MTNKDIETHFNESCARRNEFWTSVGKVDPDVLGHVINPTFMDGPRWPSLRQSFIIVRKNTSTIIASDGLSDPFDDIDESPNGEACNGFGLEFYVETPGNLEPVIGSWQFELVWQMSQNAAHAGNIQSLLRKLKYMTTELYDVSVPKEFHGDEERTGVLVGLHSNTVPSQVELSLETVDIVNVKLLTLKELQYVIKHGKEGREQLANLLLQQDNPTYSDLSRKSVVPSKAWWKI
ncbi:MAG: hypothetical protein P4L53_14935 [Candidatus Obscuribacterales bacterium]|nr:hypothetical protein [Candidatus Obscuribacterales bacterium]